MSAPVTLTGRLTAEPELRFTQSGIATARFTVVTSRRRKNDQGEWEDADTTFWRITAWRQLAEQVAEHGFEKGQAVIVQGKAHLREYETHDGQKRQSLDVNADAMGPNLRWPPKGTQRAQGGSQQAPENDPWAGPPPEPQSQQDYDEPPF